MFIIVKSKNVLKPRNVRTVHAARRIGNREIVGHGINGSLNYKDDAHFPFPAIRFKEKGRMINILREKEKGDWKCLTLKEKKTLYRASFCQTFAEFQHPTGQWKFVFGMFFFFISFSCWAQIFYHHCVYDKELPETLSEEGRCDYLRRVIELRVNPVDGISSRWNYDEECWIDGSPSMVSSLAAKYLTVFGP